MKVSPPLPPENFNHTQVSFLTLTTFPSETGLLNLGVKMNVKSIIL